MRKETILLVDDDKLIRWSAEKGLVNKGYKILHAASKKEALRAITDDHPDLILLDIMLPDGSGIDVLQEIRPNENETKVIMLTAVDRATTAIQAMKLGAFDYLTKPVDTEELQVVVEKALESARTTRQLNLLREEQGREFGYSQIIGTSSAMNEVRHAINKVAQSDITTVLITGETGTGKELIARSIHQLSNRHNSPFMTVTCSALPETLVESELFGHEKGAFTDAKSFKRGIFELADRGTVFLDEIGDVSNAIQVKLLRVVEQKAFRRVGGTEEITLDTRIIAATNQPLEKLIEEEKFRSDLYFRLKVFQIDACPLRDRGDDVLLLAEYFLRKFNISLNKQFEDFAEETKALFTQYHWPGNVRELKNVIECAALLGDGAFILPHHIKFVRWNEPAAPYSPSKSHRENVLPTLDEAEKETIRQALEKTRYNQSEAARLLKITRETLRYRMKKHGLL